ncbi:MAG TPA: family 2A encapsulin nanocompartment cargo protein cysteine desulfurase [Burkholderiales bacterium]|nr:family 2A encapsulin nanocompartment cargo protein cysteine desulfurase [Burkholderiales bacterium]
MTTGSKPDAPGVTGITLAPGLDGVPAGVPGFPDVATLTRLANAFFTALPGTTDVPAAPDAVPSPAAGSPGIPGGARPPGAPAEPAFEGAPAAAAGLTGRSPHDFLTPPAPADAEASFYFLRSGESTSPRAVPALNPVPTGADSGLGVTPPASATAFHPRSVSDLSAPPGLRLGSTAPATPGVEVGAVPAVGAIPPSSAIELPDEAALRALPGTLAGATGSTPQHGVSASAPTSASAPFYFLDSAQAAPPRSTTPLQLRPRDVNLEPMPDLGLGAAFRQIEEGGSLLPTEAAAASALPKPATPPADVPGGAPSTSAGEPSAAALYVINEARSTGAVPRAPAEPTARGATEPAAGLASAHPAFDVNAIRRDFPILSEQVHGRPLIWFDNAATTQKPRAVIDRLSYFYEHENSNIHRAAHELAARATDAYEAARDKVARFLHAASSDEIIFVRGTTEAINLVAQSWGRRHIGQGDEIVITWLEHHANIVPWQQLCAEKGARLRVAPVDDDGQVLLDEYEKLLGPRTKLVAFSQVSNALGTITPAREMVEIAHRYGARVLVDGAQSVSHMRVDVQALDCDWFVFSGHKIFGPTGIGAVYGKGDLLNATPPWQGGGNMIQDVTFEKTVYQPAPGRFEAGTGNIADAVGLGAALDYVERIGIENVGRYEHDLLVYATRGLSAIPGLRIIGTAREKASVISFVLDGFRSEDVGAALNREGIAVRAGHHCAQPILRRFGLETTVRPSLAFYNTCEEVDALVAAVHRIKTGYLPH